MDRYNEVKSAEKRKFDQEIKDYGKMAGWNFNNYVTLKQTVEKFHKKVNRIIKGFKDFLSEPLRIQVIDFARNEDLCDSFASFHGRYISIVGPIKDLNTVYKISFGGSRDKKEDALEDETSSAFANKLEVGQKLLERNALSLRLPQIFTKWNQVADWRQHTATVNSSLFLEELVSDLFERTDALKGEDVTRLMKQKAVGDLFKQLKMIGFSSSFRTASSLMGNNTMI